MSELSMVLSNLAAIIVKFQLDAGESSALINMVSDHETNDSEGLQFLHLEHRSKKVEDAFMDYINHQVGRNQGLRF